MLNCGKEWELWLTLFPVIPYITLNEATKSWMSISSYAGDTAHLWSQKTRGIWFLFPFKSISSSRAYHHSQGDSNAFYRTYLHTTLKFIGWGFGFFGYCLIWNAAKVLLNFIFLQGNHFYSSLHFTWLIAHLSDYLIVDYLSTILLKF
jgi:hypothetical protein